MKEPLPFLPSPEQPPPRTPALKRSTRTLFLWVLLVVMFLVVWQFLSPAQPSSHAPHPPPTNDGTASAVLGTLLPSGLTIGLMLLFVLAIRRRFGVQANFFLSQEPGQEAKANGRFAEAVDLFQRGGAVHAKQVGYRTAIALNTATALLWAGRFDEAIATLSGVEKSTGLLLSSGGRAAAAAQLAINYALMGDLETSDRWAAATRERLAKNTDSRIVVASFLCIADAIVLIRRGRMADASALFESHWLVMREVVTANTIRFAEIVRAFAETGAVREYNRVGERLVRIEPVLPNEFAFLGARWPEMHTFLVAHQLAT